MKGQAAALSPFTRSSCGCGLPDLPALRLPLTARYGARIEAGGDLEAGHQEFMDWARRYEDPTFSGRTRARHERWLETVPCPVLRLDGTRPVVELVSQLEGMGR